MKWYLSALIACIAATLLFAAGVQSSHLVTISRSVTKYVRTADEPRQPRSYWLAECETSKLSTVLQQGVIIGDTTITAARISSRRADVLLTRPGYQPVAAVVHRLGVRVDGWSVLSVRGPAPLKTRMAGLASCRYVMSYADVMTSLPAVAKTWLAARSTCFGSATLGGHTFDSWPCRWQSTRAGEGFTVTDLQAIGPGVTAGGSASAAAGWAPPAQDGGI